MLVVAMTKYLNSIQLSIYTVYYMVRRETPACYSEWYKVFGSTQMPGDLMLWIDLSLLPQEYAFIDHNFKVSFTWVYYHV